ncbi:HAMP domain-containing protein, partial [Jiella marina]|uniref:HAMP domain-containing protein n=1 Tax=Jiella sp. LLJ827 TaxID=2917712 RepID=UPI0021010B4D
MSKTSNTSSGLRSLTVKAAAVTVIPVLVGIAALVALELQQLKSSLYGQAEGSVGIIVGQMAEQMAGGVKWGKTEVVENVYAELAADKASGLSDVLVLDRDGAPLTSFAHEELPSVGDLTVVSDGVENVRSTWSDGHFIVATPIGGTEKPIGTLVTAWDFSHLEATADQKIVHGTLIGAVIAAFVVGIVVFFLRRSVTGPIRQTTEVMSALAAGDKTIAVPHLGRGDEIGSMAAAVQTFKAQAIEQERLEKEAEASRISQEEAKQRQAALDNAKAEDLRVFVGMVEAGFDRLSSGDLTVRMSGKIAPEFEPIRAKFNASVEALEGAIGHVVGTIGAIRTGLSEINV